MKTALVGAAVVCAALGLPAPVNAAPSPVGNFNMTITDRRDFHTWIWSVSPCAAGTGLPPDCIHVLAIPQPIAKAFNYRGDAMLVDGRYTLTVDDPFGLRCGDIYYGPTVTTHDVYTWDATTRAGTLQSSFDAGCDGAPGTLSYPFWLTVL
jgi:hypothetical protein